jgi:hypothetical protein
LTSPQPALWLTHRFSFDISIYQYKLLWMCMVRLRKLGLKPDFGRPSLALDNATPLESMDQPQSVIASSGLPFSVRYMLESLCSNNIVSYDIRNLVVRLKGLATEDEQIRLLQLIDVRRDVHVTLEGESLQSTFLKYAEPVQTWVETRYIALGASLLIASTSTVA